MFNKLKTLFFVFYATVSVFIIPHALVADALDAPYQQLCSSNECYTVLRLMGEGFFGKVFAVENSANQLFAIKIYKQYSDDLQNVRQTALKEFSRGQLLDHPHIIKSVERFTFNSEECLVLELVDGKTLFEIPKRSLSFDQSIHAALQFLDAMRYALSMDFVYLDLHENNLMLTNAFNIMVIDLGSLFSFEELSPPIENSNSTPANQLQAMANLELLSFQLITDMCFKIINKSDLPREEKIELRAAVSKLVWNYEADTEEQINAPMEDYLTRLQQFLQHALV
jgi:serine/threonine protein kinase